MIRSAIVAVAFVGAVGSAEASCFCRFTNGESICANATTQEACRRVDLRLKAATCRFVAGICPYRAGRVRG